MISQNFNSECTVKKETDYVPFSLRLSADERAMLKARSKSKSISAYKHAQLSSVRHGSEAVSSACGIR